MRKKSCRRAEGQKAEEEERLRELGYSVAGFRLFKKNAFSLLFLLGYSVAGSIFFLAIANLFSIYCGSDLITKSGGHQVY